MDFWQISAESPKFEGLAEFCGRLNFCSTDFCETKADVSTEFCENVHFLFGRFLRNKVAGLALALTWIYPPFLSAVFGGSLQVAYKEKSQGRDVGGFLFYRRSAAVVIIA